jgi:4-hydroxybenzoate polyprenyltransferase
MTETNQARIDHPNLARRLWAYQKERFPVLGHGPVILIFSLSAACYSTLLTTGAGGFDPRGAAVAFGCVFLSFLLLRIADEFKDHEDDIRYRPHRPVPRGLVTLGELRGLALTAMGIQLGLVLWHDLALLPWLVATWAYMGLMKVEFFAGHRLKRYPIVYALSHMVVMPLIVLFAAACAGGAASAPPVSGFLWLALAAFATGLVIEIGRKIRRPHNEREGVDTYSALYGRKTALVMWLVALLGSLAAATACAIRIGAGLLAAPVLIALLATAIVVATLGLTGHRRIRGKRLELFSGLFTIALYGAIGILPLVVGALGSD